MMCRWLEAPCIFICDLRLDRFKHYSFLDASKSARSLRLRALACFHCMLSTNLCRQYMVPGCVRSTQRAGHIMANLQRRTSHIALAFQIVSTLLLWFIKSSTCSSYIEVLHLYPMPWRRAQHHACSLSPDSSLLQP